MFSIPAAISIHTVTAFLYNGLARDHFERIDPRSPVPGLGVLFRAGGNDPHVPGRPEVDEYRYQGQGHLQIAELIAYAMFINLFLLGAELFKEYYSDTVHLAPVKYLYQGLDGHSDLVSFHWTATIFNLTAFFLFLIPQTRRTMSRSISAAFSCSSGVYREGMGS